MSDADETLQKKYWQSLTKPRLHLYWSFISDSNMTQNLKVKHILDKRIGQVSHHNVTRGKFESFSFVSFSYLFSSQFAFFDNSTEI